MSSPTKAAPAAPKKEAKSSITHRHPCCLPSFASIPPLPVQLVFLAHAWHGAPSPRHARFVVFDGGRCHRIPPRGAQYTGQPVIAVSKHLYREKALHTH